MSRQRTLLLPAVQVPHLYRAIYGAGDDSTIARQRQRPDPIDMSRQRWLLLTAVQVHTFNVPSSEPASEPETTRPSTVTANAQTPSPCPHSVRRRVGDSPLARQRSKACP